MTFSEKEKTIRDALGIPDDAQKVLFFTESSHWDPNWLFTSTEYYKLRINRLMDQAVRECEKEPRRVFGIECVFFLKMFWDRRPDRRDAVCRLINEGQFRMTGSGMTTPDTCVPGVEALIRDYLVGQEWLRENGMTQEPRLAYLPDNFGVIPTLPSVLRAMGYTQTSMCRIDGSFFPGTDFADERKFPLPGSSAELLMKDLKTTDFIWKGPDGSRVVCHWNPFTYGMGDNLASTAPFIWMGITFGFRSRGGRKVAKKIKSYTERLAELSRTPYLLCPMGLDFNGPIPDLIPLLDRYNKDYYPDTGIYAVNAGMDDCLELVSCRADTLPELEMDMTPYWAGFYAARPDVKHRTRKLVDDLLAAESALALATDRPTAEALTRELAPAWETATVANHHDFITGTSPDRVWKKEQLPWLIEAQETVDRVMIRAGEISPVSIPAKAPVKTPKYTTSDGTITIDTEHYAVTISEESGGSITSWRDQKTGEELLSGPFGDVCVYKDSGGLWRMGNEFNGGQLFMIERLSDRAVVSDIAVEGGSLIVTSEFTLGKRKMTRRMRFDSGFPLVRMTLHGSIGRWRGVTCRFPSLLRPREVFMDVPGGVVGRPLVKIYNPTYWAASNFAHITDPSTGRGMVLVMGGPASVTAGANGLLECISLRNAPLERAYRVLPIPAHPAYGTDFGEHAFSLAVGFTREGDWRENRLPILARAALQDVRVNARKAGLPDVGGGSVLLDADDAAVLAVKRAHRGEGVIVRLQSFGANCVALSIPGRKIVKAFLTDALERDIEELQTGAKGVTVLLAEAVTTVRLLLKE